MKHVAVRSDEPLIELDAPVIEDRPSASRDADLTAREQAELRSCAEVWKGGYYEGDPLDPMSPSTYGLMGYMSILHVTYLMCIKPYVNSSTTALEIGPGRGAWTKSILSSGAKEIWCLDALPAEHNRFWDYVGRTDRIKYCQVSDFSISMVPSDRIDYFFSFGCFCHISPALITEYMRNLFPKLKKGAHGFAMIADYDKRNTAMDDVDRYSFLRILDSKAFHGRRYLPVKATWSVMNKLIPPQVGKKLDKDEETDVRPDRWYHFGASAACEMLESLGYEVVERDVQVSHRDPVIHFRKP